MSLIPEFHQIKRGGDCIYSGKFSWCRVLLSSSKIDFKYYILSLTSDIHFSTAVLLSEYLLDSRNYFFHIEKLFFKPVAPV